jgi:hypothetical protein
MRRFALVFALLAALSYIEPPPPACHPGTRWNGEMCAPIPPQCPAGHYCLDPAD